jgi:hypothetical protein
MIIGKGQSASLSVIILNWNENSRDSTITKHVDYRSKPC